MKNTTLLQISIIVTIALQTIGIIFLPVFSFILKGFSDSSRGDSAGNSFGGYNSEDVEDLIKNAQKVVLFLLGLFCVGFTLTISLIYHIHIMKIKRKNPNRLLCYIFVIFSTLTSLVGGMLFILWYNNIRE